MDVFKSATPLIRFVNCRILRNHKLVEEELWVFEGKIIPPDRKMMFKKKEEVISLGGLIVAPGFIEVEVYGGFGIDLTHDLIYNSQALNTVAKKLPSHGITAFCPTFVSSPPDVYSRVLSKLQLGQNDYLGATVLGAHLEGPFLNREVEGNHSSRYLRTFKEGAKTLKDVYSNFNAVKIVTLAPELERSDEAVENLVSNKVIVGIAHSMATLEEAEKAHLKGANFVSHLFNGMRIFHHQDPGIVGLVLSKYTNNIFFSIVCDEYHLHPTVLRIAHKINPERLILTTMANSAMGSPKVIHHIGDKAFEVRDQTALLARKGTISGGLQPMIECVKKFKNYAQCSIVEALEAASLHPAQLLKIDEKKGNLNFGSDADFVIINDSFELISTWIRGIAVYVRK